MLLLQISWRLNTDQINQMAQRLNEWEERVGEEKRALTDLIAQTRNVELAVKTSSQDIMGKRDQQFLRFSFVFLLSLLHTFILVLRNKLSNSRLRDLQIELETSQQSRTQLERATLQMADEIRRLKSQVDNHGTELASISSEFRSRARKIEDDTRLQVCFLYVFFHSFTPSIYFVTFSPSHFFFIFDFTVFFFFTFFSSRFYSFSFSLLFCFSFYSRFQFSHFVCSKRSCVDRQQHRWSSPL